MTHSVRKDRNGKASKMGLLSFYPPLNTTHRADFVHFCSVLLSIFWLATLLALARFDRNFVFFLKCSVFAHFARSCSLLLGSAQFFAGYIPCYLYRRASCTFEIFSVFVSGFGLVILPLAASLLPLLSFLLLSCSKYLLAGF